MKENRMKRNVYSLRDLWATLKHQHLVWGYLEEEGGKGKWPEKIFEKIIDKNVPYMGKESQSKPSNHRESYTG